MRRPCDGDPTQPRLDEVVALIAARQHGVFARAQALDCGVTKGMIHHRLRTGRWERVAAGVFRIAGSPLSWRQDLITAVLAWGDGAATSHHSAAALRALAGFDPGRVELTVPRGRRRIGPGIIHRHPLSPTDVRAVDGIPATTPARTIIDLAAVAPRELVEEALDDALRRGLVSLGLVRRRLADIGRPGRPGIAMMRSILEDRDPASAVPASVFERRLLRVLLDAGLPDPVLQYEIRTAGRLIARVDFAYPAARLAIEADGYRWHSGRGRWDRDRVRLNRLTLLGWRVIHVTWTDLKRRPASIVAQVREGLASVQR